MMKIMIKVYFLINVNVGVGVTGFPLGSLKENSKKSDIVLSLQVGNQKPHFIYGKK